MSSSSRKFVHFFVKPFQTSFRKDVVQSSSHSESTMIGIIRPRSLTKKTAQNFGNTKQPWGQSDKYSHERVGIKSLSKLQKNCRSGFGAFQREKKPKKSESFSRNPKRGPLKSWLFDSFENHFLQIWVFEFWRHPNLDGRLILKILEEKKTNSLLSSCITIPNCMCGAVLCGSCMLSLSSTCTFIY